MDSAWDNFSLINDFSPETEVKIEQQLVPSKKENTLLSEPEKPAAQGLLLMLLLFGAFVASKGSSPSIPQMSDDVRQASATLLDDIFKDAGVAQASAISEAIAPLPSGHSSSWASASVISSMVDTSMVGVTSSSLGDLVDSLAQPTQEQTNEQLFSLSAAQYNGLTSQEFNNPPQRSTSQGRRNLGETLKAMREGNKKESAAEVYTRSLLWDQVPSEVVRNFAKMVSECNDGKREECVG